VQLVPSDTISVALEYVKLGYLVLPLAPREKRPHGRLVPNGLKDASARPEVLRQWWQAQPEAGVGILPPAEVLVLDLDSPDAWEELRGEFPELAAAPRQRTPRGGVHVFLRLPEGVIGGLSTSARKLPGLDLRGMGRAYLVAAPTELPNGRYVWEVPLLPPDALPLIPERLLLRLLPPPPPPPPEYQPAQLRDMGRDLRSRRLEGLLRWACERVAAAPEGARHVTLLSHARLMGGYVHLGLDPEQAAHALAEAGMRAGLPAREAESTARDGLRYGQAAPLELPEEGGGESAGGRQSYLEGRRARVVARAGGAPSAAGELVRLATESAELWRDEEGNAWASIRVEGHVENWPVRSRMFRLWLARMYYEERGRPPHAQAMQDALSALEGEALFAGAAYPVFLRVAHQGGAIWLDLGRPDWLAVQVSAGGWTVAPPEVRFRRSRATGALPVPVRAGGGALREILSSWALEEEPLALVTAWLLGALSPGPYPVLALFGEQGSGKSTLARTLQRLVDPSGDVTSLPRESRDLFIAAKNSFVLAFDNVSGLPPWLSDDLCKLSTGGLLRTRELYSNDEEIFLHAKRPVIVNGITDFITRQDLLDRSILVHLPPLEQHHPEAQLWEAFREAHPRALGELLDLAALALRELPRTRAPNVRMADFARWALAAESGYAPSGTFERAFTDMRADAVRTSLDYDPLYPVLIQLLERGPFEGSAGELLERLNELRGDTRPPEGWPRTPHAMASWLKRHAPALRRVGVEAAPLPREENRRRWRVALQKEVGGQTSGMSGMSEARSTRASGLTFAPGGNVRANVSPPAPDICPLPPDVSGGGNVSQKSRAGRTADIPDVSDISSPTFSTQGDGEDDDEGGGEWEVVIL